MLNPADLQTFIDTNGLQAAILPLSQQTATVGEAADALGVANELIIKSLVFVLNGEPLLVINNGLARVDRKKLAAHLDVGRKKVKFAAPDQVLEITGFAVGSMPPFGHRLPLRTLVDRAVVDLDEVYGGGGASDAMMRLAIADLLRCTNAEVVDLTEGSSA